MNAPHDFGRTLLAFSYECERVSTLDMLERVWRQRMLEFGFSFAALGVHVDPLRPSRESYIFHTYPAEWVSYYSERRCHVFDPVYRSAEAGLSDFVWTDRDFLRGLSWRQRRLLAEARAFGLHHGRTHALIYGRRLMASGSFVTDDGDIAPESYQAAKLINVVVHQRAMQMSAAAFPAAPELSPRERQSLDLHARGLTDGEIAKSLGVSIATVRRHIESARARLGVSTRVQAVIRAMRSGQIEPWS